MTDSTATNRSAWAVFLVFLRLGAVGVGSALVGCALSMLA
jgi:hypothetical protein